VARDQLRDFTDKRLVREFRAFECDLLSIVRAGNSGLSVGWRSQPNALIEDLLGRDNRIVPENTPVSDYPRPARSWDLGTLAGRVEDWRGVP